MIYDRDVKNITLIAFKKVPNTKGGKFITSIEDIQNWSANGQLMADRKNYIAVEYVGEIYVWGDSPWYEWFCISDRYKNQMSQVTKDKYVEFTQSALDAFDATASRILGMTIGGDNVEEVVEVKSFNDMLGDKVVDSIAHATADSLVPMVAEKVEAEIISRFGFKPIVHEIHSKDEIVYETDGVLHPMFDTVLNLVSAGIPVFLTGAAGSGKNHLCDDISKALGLEFYFLNAVTNEYKVTGFVDANGRYHTTEFHEAWTKGGCILFDEIDSSMPEVLNLLNAAIANGYCSFPHTGKVTAHENFRIIVAGNTFGTGADIEYVGRFQLDAATLDRFALVEIGYAPEVETVLAGGNLDIVEFLNDLRQSLKTIGVRHVVSYRAFDRMRAMAEILTDEDIIKMCVTKSICDDDMRLILDNLKCKTNRFFSAFENLIADIR
jgi:cobaltochelatase CobS